MPRKKQILGDVQKTTALIPMELYRELLTDRENHVAVTINEGLAMLARARKSPLYALLDKILASKDAAAHESAQSALAKILGDAAKRAAQKQTEVKIGAPVPPKPRRPQPFIRMGSRAKKRAEGDD